MALTCSERASCVATVAVPSRELTDADPEKKLLRSLVNKDVLLFWLNVLAICAGRRLAAAMSEAWIAGCGNESRRCHSTRVNGRWPMVFRGKRSSQSSSLGVHWRDGRSLILFPEP